MDGNPVTLSMEDDGMGGEGPSMDGITVDDLSRSLSTLTFIVHTAQKNTHMTSGNVEEEVRAKSRAVL